MREKKYWYGFALVVALALTVCTAPCLAGDPGVFPDKIIVGSPADLSGVVAYSTRAGIGAAKAYFAKAYAEEIYPRKIIIVQEDGGYSPATHVKAAKLLIDKHKVFCIFLTSGTAPTLGLNPVLEEEKIPCVGIYTHASTVADPFKRYLFQMNTTYSDQGRIAVDYIVEKEGKSARIAIYYQDDEFGYDGLRGFQDQMKKYGIKPVAEEGFKRGAIDVSSQALKLKAANPDYVVMNCLHSSASYLIREAKKLDWKPQLFAIGAAPDENIFELAGDAINFGKPLMGVLIAHPWPGDSWGAKEYREAMKKHNPEAPLGIYSEWAYGFAKILVEGLRRINGEPTRAKLVEALETFKGFDSGIFPPLTWGSNQRQGARAALIFVAKGNSFVPITGWRDVK